MVGVQQKNASFGVLCVCVCVRVPWQLSIT